jgi:chromosomal replication initiation ATPase DnaA
LLEVVQEVLRDHRVALVEVVSRRRYPRIVQARDAVLHRIRQTNPVLYSFPEISELFGLDHTTVIRAVRRDEARRGKVAA